VRSSAQTDEVALVGEPRKEPSRTAVEATPADLPSVAVPAPELPLPDAPAVSVTAAEVLAPTKEDNAAPNPPLARTVPRALHSAGDPVFTGVALPVSAAEPAGPSVHIGVVEIVVAAPAEKRAPAAAPESPSNLASRRYLRSL